MALQDLTPQLRTRLRRVERVVGLFVGIALLGLVAGFAYYLYYTAARRGWFVPKASYWTLLATAEGLSLGDPIVLAGFSVGEITEIEAQPPGAPLPVFLGFRIRRPYYGYVWSDSEVRIVSAELLGGRRMEVTAGRSGRPTVLERDGEVDQVLVGERYVSPAAAPKGAYVPPSEETALTARAQQLLAQIEEALPRFLGLADDAHRVLANTEQLTARLDGLARDAEPVGRDLAAITQRLRDPRGSLGEWLLPPDVRASLAATLDGTRDVAAGLQETIANLAAITATLRRDVESNEQLVSEISRLVVETDELVRGLKRHWLLRGAFAEGEGEPAPPPLEPEIAPPVR